MAFGRNVTCPCGSGKKYKKCCINNTTTEQSAALQKGKFTFVAGSYGGPMRSYFPSILCKKEVSTDKWINYYCLVNADISLDNEDDASEMANSHITRARSNSENPIEFAKILNECGYSKLDDYQMAKD